MVNVLLHYMSLGFWGGAPNAASMHTGIAESTQLRRDQSQLFKKSEADDSHGCS